MTGLIEINSNIYNQLRGPVQKPPLDLRAISTAVEEAGFHLPLTPYLPEVQHLLAAFVFAEPRGILLLGLEAPGSIATGASLQPLN